MRFFRGFGRQETPVASSSVAKQRLKVVLVSDQMRLSPGLMAAIRNDIVDVLSRRLDVDRDGIEVTITPGRNNTDELTARVPVRRAARARL
ncbi:MAG: cell division topological specificity factor MinE [Thermomicrobia bacterium]|nr:cell division topological specificity factor MinE [Thermomicrobia bacterium]